jgi:hypothetical protein
MYLVVTEDLEAKKMSVCLLYVVRIWDAGCIASKIAIELFFPSRTSIVVCLETQRIYWVICVLEVVILGSKGS